MTLPRDTVWLTRGTDKNARNPRQGCGHDKTIIKIMIIIAILISYPSCKICYIVIIILSGQCAKGVSIPGLHPYSRTHDVYITIITTRRPCVKYFYIAYVIKINTYIHICIIQALECVGVCAILFHLWTE